jgi:MerR family transcriptional regulator, copper efflux regulator
MRPIRHLPVAPPPPASRTAAVDDGARADVEEVDAQDDCGEKLLQVGDIAKVSGKTVRAIHHYEEVGLLQPHARSKGRYRLYDQAAVNRVRWIGKLHDLGLSLSQIQEIVRTWESAPSAPDAMSRMRAVYQQKLEETRAQIAHLASLEHELESSIRYLDDCDTVCDPGELVRACTNCHHHDRSRPEPELVSGLHGGTNRAAVGRARLVP